ncbi:MAG: serine/threonine-protein kinase, partial [Kiritimatiellia bacterium]|nr:serine/threonine-protein kinase [Kiritimatiellia bacterium]
MKCPDDSAGTQMKCPKCKSIVDIPAEADHAGDSLGDYELVRKVGEGGMGSVYEAIQTKLGRKVALKILPRKFTEDDRFLGRFRREARSAAMLNHPNIIQVYDIDVDSGTHFFSMEYVDGETLLQRMKRTGKLSPREAIEIIEKVADALGYAHDESIIHRDIKPENIMLSDKGRVKLADLGLAKQVDDADSNVTQSGAAVGTPYYMAPEQA